MDIYNPVSPCIRTSHSIKEVTEILVSYGGGMGGVNQKYYAKHIDAYGDSSITITDYLGEKIILNTRFIVYRQPKNMVICVYNTTGWRNYSKSIVASQHITKYYICSISEDVNFHDTFFDNADSKNKLIDTIVDEIKL